MFILPLSLHGILTWLAILLSITILILLSCLCTALRRRHEATWVALGEPTAIYNFSREVQSKVNRFLWRREYKRLADPGLDRLAIAIKLLTFVVVVTILLAGAFWTRGE